MNRGRVNGAQEEEFTSGYVRWVNRGLCPIPSDRHRQPAGTNTRLQSRKQAGVKARTVVEWIGEFCGEGGVPPDRSARRDAGEGLLAVPLDLTRKDNRRWQSRSHQPQQCLRLPSASSPPSSKTPRLLDCCRLRGGTQGNYWRCRLRICRTTTLNMAGMLTDMHELGACK